MSSLRRILSSRANGALSRGPKTPLGKQHSSKNALTHGLTADTVILKTEPSENYEVLLGEHLDRFDPADGVEYGMIEEMAAASWRMRRAWAIETRIFDNQISPEPSIPDDLDKMAKAFAGPDGGPPNLALLHRYETRLHLMYQRSMHNMLLLRALGRHNEPNPISEHPMALPAPETPDSIQLAILPPVRLPEA
jgi:hypothetical protein